MNLAELRRRAKEGDLVARQQLVLMAAEEGLLPPRCLEVRGETVNEEERSVEVVLSSERAVEMFDWDSWEFVPEVLLADGVVLPEGRSQVPLLDAHKRNTSLQQIGSVRGVRTEGELTVGRAYFGETEAAKEIWSLVRGGHLRDVSIGYDPQVVTRVKKGEEYEVRGRKFKGPVNVVGRTVVKELSFVPIGANLDAQVRGARELFGIGRGISSISRQENEPMKVRLKDGREVTLAEIEAIRRGGKDVVLEDGTVLKALRAEDDVDPKQVAAVAKKAGEQGEDGPNGQNGRNGQDGQGASVVEVGVKEAEARGEQVERERVKGVRALCQEFKVPGELESKLIDEGKSIDEARAAVLDHLKGNNKPFTAAPVELGRDAAEKFHDAAVDGILIRSGFRVDKPAEGAHECAGMSGQDLARECLMLQGHNPREVLRMDASELFEASVAGMSHVKYQGREKRNTRGLSTRDGMMGISSFPNLTLDAANIALMDGFDLAETTYELVSRADTVDNYQAKNIVGFGEQPRLESHGEHGEKAYGRLVDLKEQITVTKKSLIIGFTEEFLVNNRVDEFMNQQREWGMSIRNQKNEEFWNYVMSNPTLVRDSKAIIHADHGNTDSADALDAAALETLVKKMMAQKGNGEADAYNTRRLVRIRPRYLVVPPSLWKEARELVESLAATDATNGNSNIKNVFQGLVEVVVEPELEYGSSGSVSATQYWGFADPAAKEAFRRGMLNGRNAPEMKTRISFTTDGFEVSVSDVWGFAPVHYQAVYYNAGA